MRKRGRNDALASYLLVAALLFSIGLAGALTRPNAILVLIGIELMLNAANLNLIAFWRYGPHPELLTGMSLRSLDCRGGGGGCGGARSRDSDSIARETTDLDAMNRMKG